MQNTKYPEQWTFDASTGRIGTAKGTIVVLPRSDDRTGRGYTANEQLRHGCIIAQAPAMLEALRRAQIWLARAQIEGIHLPCAAPNDLPAVNQLVADVLDKIPR